MVVESVRVLKAETSRIARMACATAAVLKINPSLCLAFRIYAMQVAHSRMIAELAKSRMCSALLENMGFLDVLLTNKASSIAPTSNRIPFGSTC